MDETLKASMHRWLVESRSIALACNVDRVSDDSVLTAMWQEVCDIAKLHANGRPMFSDDGTLLDEKGNRSIFDDVDH